MSNPNPKIQVALLPGEDIGPELTAAVLLGAMMPGWLGRSSSADAIARPPLRL